MKPQIFAQVSLKPSYKKNERFPLKTFGGFMNIFGPTVLWKLIKLKSKTVFFILSLLLKPHFYTKTGQKLMFLRKNKRTFTNETEKKSKVVS